MNTTYLHGKPMTAKQRQALEAFKRTGRWPHKVLWTTIAGLKARGLVTENTAGRWLITADGNAALDSSSPEEPTPCRP